MTTSSDYIQAVTDLAEGVRIAGGTEAITMLTRLLNWGFDPTWGYDPVVVHEKFYASAPTNDITIPTPIISTTDPVNNFLVRNALAIRIANITALAYAISEYVPRDSQDAQNILDQVLVLFDDATLECSDAGYDNVVLALRNLKSVTVTYLENQVITQPELIIIDLKSNQPSLVVAYKLYRDATRADELTTENDPQIDLFLPTVITALSS